jgi:hypothetical protein
MKILGTKIIMDRSLSTIDIDSKGAIQSYEKNIQLLIYIQDVPAKTFEPNNSVIFQRFL